MSKVHFAIILASYTMLGCSNDNDSTPPIGEANEFNQIIGLWRVEHEIDEDSVIDKNDPVDLYAEYLEITNDSYILYVTDGTSNCYDADSFPLTYNSGIEYSIDLGDNGTSLLNLEATESILTLSYIEDNNTNTSETELFTRVENVTSQDFNECSF